MDYIIATDITCDLPESMLSQMGVALCEMAYYVDDVPYGENGNKLGFHDFYEAMRQGSRTSTSMINEESARDFLSGLLAQGKNVLYISFASVLSGTYDNFKRVAEELNANNALKVCVVDSKCAAGGEGLLVTLVAEKAKAGATFKEACAYAQEMRDRVLHYFMVDDLKYLARGGRLSKSSAFFGNMLNIKPVLHVDQDGRLIPIKKVIGRKKAFNTLVEKMEERYNRESDCVYVSYGDCYDDAKYVADAIEQKFGVTVTLLPLCFVIGSHTGPGTITLFFTGDSRVENQ